MRATTLIATLALTRHQAPLEYGMVVTRPDGRVERRPRLRTGFGLVTSHTLPDVD